jgi:hypothetical protein
MPSPDIYDAQQLRRDLEKRDAKLAALLSDGELTAVIKDSSSGLKSDGSAADLREAAIVLAIEVASGITIDRAEK